MHLHSRARRATIFHWLIACFLAIANSFAAETNTYLRLHFQTNSTGQTIVQYGEKVAAALSNATQILNFNKLIENKGTNSVEVSIIPTNAITVVDSEQFPGWKAELPMQQSASFSLDYPTKTIDLQTSDLNHEPIHLAFPDGATVEMEGHADARLQMMEDGTYVFYGSGKMNGISADGQQVRFGYVFPPLFGGKLITPPAGNPNGRFKRATPVSQLTLTGGIDTGVSAQVGKKTAQLQTDKPLRLRDENGAEISLELKSSTHTVDWEVQRGIFRINVDNFRCWKTLAAAGQSAAMQWDTNGVLIELRNKNGTNAFEDHLLVNLNPTLNVAVGKSSTFQYGRTTDCSTFVATAYGGETTMYNAESGRYVRLDEGNMNFISGTPDSLPAKDRHFTPVHLVWETNDKVEFKSETGQIAVGIGGHETFQADANTQLDINYFGPEKLVVHVEAGATAITPSFMPHITVEVVEGSTVTFGYDAGTAVFRVEPDNGNLSPIAIRTPNGFYPRIVAGSRITFVVNRSPFLGDGGDVIFTEIAGAGPVTTVERVPYRPLPTGRGQPPIDNTHVDQPPVSTR